jgi:hypothetical protein
MAVANTKSAALTALDTVPQTMPNAFLADGVQHSAVGVAAVAVADDDGSVYRFVRVPSNARLTSVRRANDAITGGTAFDLNIYETADNGGALVKAKVVSGLNLSGAATEIIVPLAVADREKRVWELVGLSADPRKMYDLCLSGTTVGTTSGNIALLVDWVE